MTKLLTCPICKETFKSIRALSVHQIESSYCSAMKQLLEYKILELKNQHGHKTISEEENNLMDLDDDNIVINDNDSSHDDNDSIVSANSGIDVLTNTFIIPIALLMRLTFLILSLTWVCRCMHMNI